MLASCCPDADLQAVSPADYNKWDGGQARWTATNVTTYPAFNNPQLNVEVSIWVHHPSCVQPASRCQAGNQGRHHITVGSTQPAALRLALSLPASLGAQVSVADALAGPWSDPQVVNTGTFTTLAGLGEGRYVKFVADFVRGDKRAPEIGPQAYGLMPLLTKFEVSPLQPVRRVTAVPSPPRCKMISRHRSCKHPTTTPA